MSETKTCEYGCGQEAEHQLKNGKWCCSESHNSCPAMRKKNSKTHKEKGSMPWHYGNKPNPSVQKECCSYCGKEFSQQNIKNHECACRYNPDNDKLVRCIECGTELTTKYQEEFCSTSCAAKYNNRERRNNGFYENWESKLIGGCNCGYHQTWFGEEVYLRSVQEFDYAKKLDEQKVHYEVEELRILYEWDGEEHTYIPDFHIPSRNLIVEIKGSYFYNKSRKKVETKLKACRDRGYDIRLIVDGEMKNLL